MKSDKTLKKMPDHIAFIMDGNGRWASKRLLPRKAGHGEGVKTMRKIVAHCIELGIPYLSFFAFSTENKNRPKDEVDSLIKLIRDNIYKMMEDFIKNGVKIVFMGNLEYFPDDVKAMLDKVKSDSASGTKTIVNVALNYGSRSEIVRAVNQCVREGREVDENTFSQYLYTAQMPDPDLIIRTSGEFRLSNFMLYQLAYSEVSVTKTLWPDFNEKELNLILDDYRTRDRRFGKI